MPSFRKCKICNKDFLLSRKDRVTCSELCNNKSQNLKKGYNIPGYTNCFLCEKIFLQKRGNQIYCSKSCRCINTENKYRTSKKCKFSNILPPKEIQILLEEHKETCLFYKLFICFYCNKVVTESKNRALDHFIPVNKNGSNSNKNLIQSCKICNTIKSDKLIMSVLSLEKFQLDRMYENETR